MSSKLKKLIISLVVFVLVGAIALAGVTIITKLSSSTVYDLKFVENSDSEEEVEIHNKEVYLLNEEKNRFSVKLSASASSYLNYVVYSTNKNIADVEAAGNNIYEIEYYKAGEVEIIATPEEKSNIKESFKLVVKENLPDRFSIDVDASNNLVVDSSHIKVFADSKEYSFIFSAGRGNLQDSINIGGLYILDDYNKDVFTDVTIRNRVISVLDPETNEQVDREINELVIRANQSEESLNEQLTIQSKYNGEDGTVIETFTFKVDVMGNYIDDIQLVVSKTPNFSDYSNIFGEGLIKENERKIDTIYLTKDVNTIYAKVRVVYTNGDIVLADDDVVTAEGFNEGTLTDISKEYGNYYIIEVSGYFRIKCVHTNSDKEAWFQFNYVGEDIEGNTTYSDFKNKQLYRKVIDQINEIEYYEYIYWDTRFMRDDAVTVDGKIVGFKDGNPDCNVFTIEKPEEPEEPQPDGQTETQE